MKELTKAQEQIMQELWTLEKAFIKDTIDRLPDPKPAYNNCSFTSQDSRLRKDYETIYPDQPFEYFSLDDKMRFDLKPDKTFAFVFSVFSGLAIFIAVLGIIGLAFITINQNLKGFGIRKVLGTEFGYMSGLLLKQFMVQFIVAIIIAEPLSYNGYKDWFLSIYIHRIDFNIRMSLTPVILLLSVKVFRLKTAEVLQYE